MGAGRRFGVLAPTLLAPRGAPGLDVSALSAQVADGYFQPSAATLVTNAIDTLAELELGGFSRPGLGEDSCAWSSPASHVAEAVHMMGECPSELSPAIAACEIHVRTDYRGEPCSAVALDETRVSLPERGTHPVCLSQLLGPTGRDEVKSFISHHILPYSEGG